MAENGRNLTAAQERALMALLSSRTLQEASKASGVAYRTLSRWMAEEAFSRAYRERLDSLVVEAASAIKQSLSSAVSVLRRITEDECIGAGYRISAARALLDAGLRYTETIDILQRLEAIENAIDDQDTG